MGKTTPGAGAVFDMLSRESKCFDVVETTELGSTGDMGARQIKLYIRYICVKDRFCELFGQSLGYKVFVKFYDELNDTNYFGTLEFDNNTKKQSIIPELNPKNDGVMF